LQRGFGFEQLGRVLFRGPKGLIEVEHARFRMRGVRAEDDAQGEQ
jgi:hypothetical protein